MTRPLKHARSSWRLERAAANRNGLATTQEYSPFLGDSQLAKFPQRPLIPIVGRKPSRDLAVILADLDQAFKLGKYDLAARLLKEWRAAKQGGAT